MTRPILQFDREDELLRAMSGWMPLPSEDDPGWDADGWAWSAANRLVAAADLAGERGWRRVATLVFEHATAWDANGAMQGLRHGPERAFAADSDAFADALHPLLTHARDGARYQAARELGILRRPVSLTPLLAVADSDPNPAIAHAADQAIWLLAQDVPDTIPILRPGSVGDAWVYPADPLEWAHLRPGDRITLHGDLTPLASGIVTAIKIQ